MIQNIFKNDLTKLILFTAFKFVFNLQKNSCKILWKKSERSASFI